MRATFANAKEFTEVMKTLAEFIDIVTFEFNEDGLKILTMDPARVALFRFTVPKSEFKEYELDEPVKVGIPVSSMKKLFSRLNKKHALTIEVPDPGRVVFEVKNKATKRFIFAQVSPEELDIEEENIDAIIDTLKESPVNASLSVGGLKEALRDIKTFDDAVKIYSSGDSLKLKTLSGERGEIEITFEDGMGAVYEINVTDDVKSAYNLNYLLQTLKNIGKEKVVTIHFNNDSPLYGYVELDSGGKLEFLIAPRVDE